jgi:hypothetical protein
MLRAFGYFVLLIFITIYIVSSYSGLTTRFVMERSASNSLFATNGHRYGDMFALSYLPQYKVPAPRKSDALVPKCDVKKGINLYILCDSYIWEFIADKKYFCGVDSFKCFYSYGDKVNTKLDHQKDNVFLFEMSERRIRSMLALSDTAYINHLFNTNYPPLVNIDSLAKNHSFSARIKAFLLNVKAHIFNGSISTNLELNVWDSSIFSPIKEFKSYLNYKLFNIIDENVTISPDKKRLFYTPTIDTAQNSSSFQSVSDKEIAFIVEQLNGIYEDARKSGFNIVYLSIIPNAVSILYPNYNGLKYNNLITRIQNSPELKMKVVDIYSTYKKTTIPVYAISDSHWNLDGAHIWLNQFNNALTIQSANWAMQNKKETN